MGRGRLTELTELREAIEHYSAGFDPALVSAADAASVVDDASAIEKMAATLRSMAAARAAETGEWRRRGARSPAHDLAQRTGTSVGAAADALEAARRLGELPVLAGAAKRGEVSPQQLAAIADAASADPGAEARLVATSRRSSLAELRDECARTKAAARPHDAEARHGEVHRTRSLRTFTDRDGGWNLAVRNVPEVGAELMAMLRPLQDRAFRRARAEGRQEPVEAYGADALAEMVRMAASPARGAAPARAARRPEGAGEGAAEGAGEGAADEPAAGEAVAGAGDGAGGRGATGADGGGAGDGASDGAADVAAGDAGDAGDDGGGGDGTDDVADAGPGRAVVPIKIIVRADWDALVRGFPAGGEVCEIVGIGPVPVSVVRAMFATGDPFLAMVVTKGVDVVNVAHLGRRATAHQVSALQWRDPVCPAEGCNRTANLEIDHREDWATTRITLLGLLDRPCDHHHDLKTREGWAFVAGVGKRPMVPPDDPRHPKNLGRAGPGPEPAPPPGPQPGTESGPADTGPARAA